MSKTDVSCMIVYSYLAVFFAVEAVYTLLYDLTFLWLVFVRFYSHGLFCSIDKMPPS